MRATLTCDLGLQAHSWDLWDAETSWCYNSRAWNGSKYAKCVACCRAETFLLNVQEFTNE